MHDSLDASASIAWGGCGKAREAGGSCSCPVALGGSISVCPGLAFWRGRARGFDVAACESGRGVGAGSNSRAKLTRISSGSATTFHSRAEALAATSAVVALP
jgi:hypothetical protein